MKTFPPPFHERTIRDADGRYWGVHSTAPQIAGGFAIEPPPGSAPRERWMTFRPESGEAVSVQIGLDHPSHRDATDEQLLDLLAGAE